MAEWDTAYVNALPDSAFLLVFTDAKGDKQRLFPVRNSGGAVDAAHLRNALARIPQATTITASQRAAAMTKAKALAKAHSSIGGPSGTYEGTAGDGRSRMPDEVMGLQVRSYLLELRTDGDGRTILGRAVPYGETTMIPGGRERFLPGAFSRQISSGQLGSVKLFASHAQRTSGEMPIGKTLSLVERQDGLHGAWPLYNTSKAADALELVRTGEVTGLSIGFKAGETQRGSDGAYERVSAHLDHVVLTHEPAYSGAAVTSLRSSPVIVGNFRRELEQAKGILARVRAGE